MSVLDLSFWRARLRLLGFIAIVIGAGLGDGVHRRRLYLPLLPRAENRDSATGRDHGFTLFRPLDRQISLDIRVHGCVVAVNQNFMGWVKISKGEFAFNEQLYMDPFLLSGGALFIIIGQCWLLLTAKR